MRCDPCRTRGLPVGSGIAESACNCIVGNRFKQSGCRWSKAGANAVLAIGRCFENMRWPDFFNGGLAAPQPPNQRKWTAPLRTQIYPL